MSFILLGIASLLIGLPILTAARFDWLVGSADE